jgi:hypothetical protein
MEFQDLKGLAIFSGIFAIYTIGLFGYMERHLKKIDKLIKCIENDSKYVN